MDYIIVGGGIAGLYSAYKIFKNFGSKKIIIIEKSNRLGGRINTKRINGIDLEYGAGRISTKHLNMLDLIHELGLDKNLTKPRGGRSFIKTSSIKRNGIHVYNIDKIIPIESTNFYDIIDFLFKKLSDVDFLKLALNYTLHGLVEKIYDANTANNMVYHFGYSDDFYEQNSVNALIMFKKTFHKKAMSYGVTGGMIQIIKKLEDYLDQNGIPIQLGSECTAIYKKKSYYDCELKNGEIISAKNIICAIPKENLIRIKFFESIRKKIDSVIAKPLIRIYMFFPVVNGKVWFDKFDTVLTTNTILSQIIPIDKNKGVTMIYCDGNNAETLFRLYENNLLEQEIIFHLRKIFSEISIPKPNEIYVSYYSAATHFWKPSVNSYQLYENMIQPFKTENIFIVGEAYAQTQQWSEGAIETVNYLVDNVFEKTSNLNT